LADGVAFPVGKRWDVERFEDQPGYVVIGRIDQRLLDNLCQREIREGEFGCDPLALGCGCDAGQLVARFFFVGLGQKIAEIGKDEPFATESKGERHGSAQPRCGLCCGHRGR
jgi:hypothetical protein